MKSKSKVFHYWVGGAFDGSKHLLKMFQYFELEGGTIPNAIVLKDLHNDAGSGTDNIQ